MAESTRKFRAAAAALSTSILAACGSGFEGHDGPGVCNGPPRCVIDPSAVDNGQTGSQRLRVVQVANASDLIFVPATGKVFVSVKGNPGSLVPIDPVAASLSGAPIAVGIDPVKLARSDDDAFIYVGFSGQNSVQRVDLASGTVALTIPLGSDPFFGPIYAEDLEVLPGNPQSIAVSRRYQGVSPRHVGVAIFDDAVQRAAVTSVNSDISNVIEFSAASNQLYGYNNETTEFGFRRMDVNAGGVTVSNVQTSLISGFNVDIRFDGGSIFTTSGIMIDPVAGTPIRTFTLTSPFGNLVVPDAALGRVFYLANESGWVIHAFSIATGALLGSEPIVDDPTTTVNENVAGTPINMVRWGTNGLAFVTDQGQVFLVASPNLIP